MSSTGSLLPAREPIETDASPEMLSLDEADEVVDALTAGTARALLSQIYEEPATISDLAATLDTSLQNAQYHLEKLREAGLVTAVDTWYSEKGREMKVYGPSSEPLVIVTGGAGAEADLERAVAECQ